MFAIIQAAGWPIWFLLLASIIALALIIERSVSLRDRKIIPPMLFDEVVAVYQRQGVSEEMLVKLGQDSPLGAVLAAGTARRLRQQCNAFAGGERIAVVYGLRITTGSPAPWCSFFYRSRRI